HTEAVSVLLRGEPVVVVGRRGILLIAQKSIQVGLLRAGQAENQRSADRQVWCRAALIIFSLCQRMSGSSDSRHCRRINRTRDSVFDRMLAHSRATDEEHYRNGVRCTSTDFRRHKSVYRSDIGPSTRAELVAGVYSGYSSKGCIPKPQGKNFVSRVPKSQLIVSRRTCECMVLRGFLGQRQFSMRHPSLRSAAVC